MSIVAERYAKTLRLFDERILVERCEASEFFDDDQLIQRPDIAKEKSQEGVVLRVGPGRLEKGELIKPDVKPGDRVLFALYCGVELNFGLVIVYPKDIYAVIEGVAEKRAKNASVRS